MQQTPNGTHLVRSSYGFQGQETQQFRHPQPKHIQLHSPVLASHHYSHGDSTFTAVKQHDLTFDAGDGSSRRKMNSNEGLTFTGVSGGQPEHRFKPQFLNANSLKADDQQSDQVFLRNSCSNVLRKFEQTNNLRNTTHFNPLAKLGQLDSKKPEETNPPPKLGFPIKNFGAVSENNLLRPAYDRPKQSNLDISTARTPNKLFTSKQDLNVSYSKTPVKYKNVFEQQQQANSNKNSAISKESTEAEEKKTFRSLNEIVANKNKEKIAQETSRGIIKRSKILNGFEMGAVLGRGKFGQVFLSRHKQAGFVVAIKKIVKSKVIEFKMVQQLSKQIQLHACLDHPNIVRFYGCFEEKEDIYLVMEYMNGGTLFDYLNEVNCLSLKETVDYLTDIIEAITYMHEKSIAHRDIKPENIVISSEGVAKLCDFGWSAVVETSRKTYCGTFDYAPPEILERKNYDASVDIWCIGVLTYELLTGRVPFEGDKRNVVMDKIVNVDKNKIDYPSSVPPEAREFIESLVQKDPNQRPKSHDLLKFKLFSLFPARAGRGKRGQ